VSSSESSNHDGRFQVAQRKKQKGRRKETINDLGASLLSNDNSNSMHRNSDKLPTGGQNLDSFDTDCVDNIIRRLQKG